MRFRQTTQASCARDSAGFTLAEVLAALTFMAIVIPVAVQGLRIANTAGQVGLRKAVAARIADRMLNEMVVTSESGMATSSGTVQEGTQVYTWTTRSETWSEDSMQELSVQVTYQVQGHQYEVQLSTLVDTSVE